ncbi:dynein assembly factor 4, axonemal [Triplophysa dalaica]|uniref:dynein assembly factor 4, axonemal n=1 Tax=Triplophysa dalaica TaxID=1582913 RepID=UPI0024E00C2A|nr:dynein assembly factor 4, axonemal [Triplophysa dalaica]
MPLTVRDYTWTQSESSVYISVPLKGIKTTNVDVICTDEYLKVSFPPFLFEAFLFGEIDEEKSVAKIGSGVAVFTLQKKKHEVWEKLFTTLDKERQRQMREQAIVKVQNKAEEKFKAKASRIQQEKKFALETMMKLEKEERERIQMMKDEECLRATAELEVWRETQRKTAEETQKRSSSTTHNNKPDHQKTQRVNVTSAIKPLHNPANTSTDQKNSKQKYKDLPAPRSAGCIQISFTPRVFPTALRESRVLEEEEWLMKQAEARRAADSQLDELKDLTDEERNPDWLKEKADKFFLAGNYHAAVNAYSLAIKLNRKIPALFSNRAACHLKMRNLHKALEDSSRALELLTPAVPANAPARLKAHVRRGTAFCELELYVEGLQDYQAAVKLDPENAALQADTVKIRQIIQGSTPSS